MLSEQGKQVLVIQAQEREIGPDYLRFGLSLSTDFSGNAYFQARASFRRTWVNALGAQWRTDLLLGRINQLQSEFYQPLRVDQTAFVAPYVDLEQKPFDIYDGGNRVARFLRQSGTLGLDVGTQWSTLGELRLGLYRGARSYKLDTGSTALLTDDSSIRIGGAACDCEATNSTAACFRGRAIQHRSTSSRLCRNSVRVTDTRAGRRTT